MCRTPAEMERAAWVVGDYAAAEMYGRWADAEEAVDHLEMLLREQMDEKALDDTD